ncbi:MAG: N-acetylglucosamine-6-phosphate deacetylase [Clostridia bacterium]|nr:N-acetylglucosamine-6-phosphate deacetylase [Clostridia bacterium]
MKCIINGKIITPSEILDGYVLVFDEKIKEIVKEDEIPAGCEVIDAHGAYVAPGLVDIHIHGYVGEDTSDGSIEGLEKMATSLVANGVTSFCPTTMTVAKDQIERAFQTARDLKAKEGYHGANVLGINCEGPFINPSKKGAQMEEHILPPDGKFIVDNADIVKLVTIAPEMDGALDAIKYITENSDVLVSTGHTNATFEEANLGIEAGVRHTTHLFNAMTPLMHRNPGVVGSALSHDEVSCEMICDTFHINKGLFEIVAKLKGDKLCLITDCMRAGGMPDGHYDLGGQAVNVSGIKCLLEDGTIAGSVLKLNLAVKNFYENTSVGLVKAFAAASLNPAKAIREDARKGSIEPGKDADIIIIDSNFNIINTFIGGTVRYENN